jgi:hypothetical protein
MNIDYNFGKVISVKWNASPREFKVQCVARKRRLGSGYKSAAAVRHGEFAHRGGMQREYRKRENALSNSP